VSADWPYGTVVMYAAPSVAPPIDWTPSWPVDPVDPHEAVAQAIARLKDESMPSALRSRYASIIAQLTDQVSKLDDGPTKKEAVHVLRTVMEAHDSLTIRIVEGDPDPLIEPDAFDPDEDPAF